MAEASIFLRFFSVFFTHCTQAIHITLPFIISAFMVRDWEEEKKGEGPIDEQTIGRLVGLLGASFCASQLLTSYGIGKLSDRIGRKPIVVIGNISCVVSATMFGLADSYGTAVVARVLGGLFNGIIGAEKAMFGEALDSIGQGIAFSYFSIAWGLGALAGPLLGGLFAKPCSGMLQGTAVCGPDSLLQRRPYVLPCLVAAALSVVATVLVVCMLEETLPSLRSSSGNGVAYAAVPSEDSKDSLAAGGIVGKLGLAEAPAGADAGLGLERELELGRLPGSGSKGSSPGGGDSKLGSGGSGSSTKRPWRDDSAHYELGSEEELEEGVLAASGTTEQQRQQQQQQQQCRREQPVVPRYSLGALDDEDDEEQGEGLALLEAGGRQHLSAGEAEAGAEGERWGHKGSTAASPQQAAAAAAAGAAGAAGDDKQSARPWYRQQRVLTALAGYGLIAFDFNYSDELVPIYASAPQREGGLGFSTSALAPSLSFGGMVLMLWALFGFPRMLKRFGPVFTCRSGLLGTPAFALLYPLASLVAGRMASAQTVMFLAMGLRGIASTNAFTACIILVNQSAPQGTLGAVNGAGQTLASFVRALAPALGGLSWGWSTALKVPGHQFLPFGFMALVALGTLLVYKGFKLPETEVVEVGEARAGKECDGD